MATKTFERPFAVDNKNSFSEALDELNTKIDNVKKNITYLDIYNITTVVTNKERLASQINALMPNSSLIINTPPFYLNDVSYNTGDIILKLSNGNTVHINAQPGGIYYPSQITQDGSNYNLVYQYDTAAPTEISSNATINSEATKAQKMTFTGLTGPDATSSNIYGLWESFGEDQQTYSFDKKNNIKPYIKFYLTNNNAVEEVFLEYNLTTNTTDASKWTVTIERPITGLWIKVK